MKDYAKNENEAIERFLEYRSLDPFPEIKPALLNSADICTYVAATGMIYPFDPENLKPASYALRLLGNYVFWDENGEKKTGRIEEGESFTLKSDSIAFVSLEPLLQLPDYIAARFNLKIDNVYRGLLLGTGPLVDPGFIGRLSFPLHNLTSNDYIFTGGERLAWMEFTKLSENAKWLSTQASEDKETKSIPRIGEYKKNRFFRHDKPKTVQDFVREAESQRPVRSSIPLSVSSSEEAAIQAAESAKKTAKWFSIAQWIAVITILISVAFIIFNVISIHNDTTRYVREAQISQQNLFSKLVADTSRIRQLELEVDSLFQRVKKLESKP